MGEPKILLLPLHNFKHIILPEPPFDHQSNGDNIALRNFVEFHYVCSAEASVVQSSPHPQLQLSGSLASVNLTPGCGLSLPLRTGSWGLGVSRLFQ